MGHPSPQNRLDLRQLIGAPAVLVTRRSATTSQARCGYTPASHMTGRRVRMLPWDPLWRLRHVGHPVSPRGYRGLPAFASLSMADSDRVALCATHSCKMNRPPCCDQGAAMLGFENLGMSTLGRFKSFSSHPCNIPQNLFAHNITFSLPQRKTLETRKPLSFRPVMQII